MPYDIKNTSTGDTDLTGGDIQYTESTYQHQRDLIIGRRYDFRQSVGVGCGAEDFINDNIGSADGFNRTVRIQFMRDGMRIIKFNYPYIDAEYKNS